MICVYGKITVFAFGEQMLPYPKPETMQYLVHAKQLTT